MHWLAIATAIVFALLAALHLYWAFGGRWAAAVAVPEVRGAPLFRPGRAGTLIVAALLALAATFVLQRGGIVGTLLPEMLTLPNAADYRAIVLLRGARARNVTLIRQVAASHLWR